ncbi:MAG: lysozyme inhibitor LprI family protein [Spirulinaceae cyanobacterium]
MQVSVLSTVSLSCLAALALLLPSSSTPATAQALLELDCENPQTQMAMNMCEQRRWQASDRTLNQTYQALRVDLPSEARRSLLIAQMMWLGFRDAECKLDSSYAEGGSMQPMLYSGCAASLTDQRQRDLATYQQSRLPYGSDRDYATVDRVLNHVYQALQDSISEHRQDELVAAELAWIDYRDAVCAFEQHQAQANWVETANANADAAHALEQCQIRLTEQRVEQLLSYLLDAYRS